MKIGDSFSFDDGRVAIVVPEQHEDTCDGCVLRMANTCARGSQHGPAENHSCSRTKTIFMLDGDEARALAVKYKLSR